MSAVPPQVPQEHAPRWTMNVTCKDGGRVSFDVAVLVDDVARLELAKALIAVANGLLEQPMAILPTVQVAQRAHRHAVTTRDYPAKYLHPSKVLLCAACEDLYSHMLEGGPGALVELPVGMAAPCTFHLDPSQAPVSFEDAAKMIPAGTEVIEGSGEALLHPGDARDLD